MASFLILLYIRIYILIYTQEILRRETGRAAIRDLYEETKIPSGKENPKSLRKLYLSTGIGIESNISLLVEQAMERMMEQEQFSVGWEEQ